MEISTKMSSKLSYSAISTNSNYNNVDLTITIPDISNDNFVIIQHSTANNELIISTPYYDSINWEIEINNLFTLFLNKDFDAFNKKIEIFKKIYQNDEINKNEEFFEILFSLLSSHIEKINDFMQFLFEKNKDFLNQEIKKDII